MAVDVAVTCEALHARYAQLVLTLAGMPVGSVSEGGRSMSGGSAEVKEQMEFVAQQAAALGCPIGTLNEPFMIITGAKATR